MLRELVSQEEDNEGFGYIVCVNDDDGMVFLRAWAPGQDSVGVKYGTLDRLRSAAKQFVG